ncbi:DoxX family membrane protein [Streptomyces iconiensis]|uniref:DoxX family membrane protein n=1 Tax=Streptomyces iconiensis TaxID=1384038 RepID=A0ABT7A9J5_9ACTN|nr:DoxX family membrane protein [Streptomyces iconiensis]MDJ1137965.1 DoxX family membrane protein [Streptomyces iconiensis]
MKLLHLVARPLIGSIFLTAGVQVLRSPEPPAGAAEALLAKVRGALPAFPEDDVAVVRANAAVHVVAGGLLALGKAPRLAALALAVSLVPTMLAAHSFWEYDEQGERDSHRLEFAKDAAVLGGLLAVISDARHLARERVWREKARNLRRRQILSNAPSALRRRVDTPH